jgi:hypothetical protein
MLVDYFKEAHELLPFMYKSIKVIATPTTFLNKGEEYSLNGKGNLFRVLTPKGQENNLENIDNLLEKWGRLGIQQLAPTNDGVFVFTQGSQEKIKWYDDYYCEIPKNGCDKAIEEAIIAVGKALYDRLCDPLVLRGFTYKGCVFVYEIGPVFLYNNDKNTIQYYFKLMKERGVEEVLKRVDWYKDFLGEATLPPRMVQEALYWIWTETGGGSYVGVVEGEGKLTQKKYEGLRPMGRLYQIAELKDLPELVPYADSVIFVLSSEVVSTPRLEPIWSELLNRIESWDVLTSVEIFLEGISTQEEFRYIAKKLKTDIPIGISIATWGQLLRVDKKPVPSAHGVMVNVDSLVDDGIFFHLHEKMKVESLVHPLLHDVLSHRTLGKDISVLYTEEWSLEDRIKLCRYADRVFTTVEEYFPAIMSLASSKI